LPYAGGIMPFKSEAQRIKFKQLVKDKKITQSTYNEFEKGTPDRLPPYVAKKGPATKRPRRLAK